MANKRIIYFVKFRDIESLDRSIVTELIDNIWIHENNLIEIGSFNRPFNERNG